MTRGSREMTQYYKWKPVNCQIIPNQEKKDRHMADDNEKLTPAELLQTEAKSWSQLYYFIESAALKCLLHLDIPNVIAKHGKPMTLSHLIASLPITPSKIPYFHRLTRIFVHFGMLILDGNGDDEGYSLAPADRYAVKKWLWDLIEDHDPFFRKAWDFLGDWFKNEDASAFYTAYGEHFWDRVSRDVSAGNWFNEIMARDSRNFMRVLLDEYEHVFKGLTSLVDVGGGTGTVATAIANSFPHMKCTVLELPIVIANMQGSENLECVAGDMFQNIPHANALLLKSILHDWNDEECLKILKNCKKAIQGNGKVIIIDMVMENSELEKEAVLAQLFIDMLMLILNGSKERNKKEWEKLFLDAGFSNYKMNQTLGLRSVIELYL